MDATTGRSGRFRELGRICYERRSQLDLTQAQLADRAGISLGAVTRFETGHEAMRRSPSWAKLEVALGWPRGYIEDYLDGRAIGAPIHVPDSSYVRVPVGLTAEIVTDIADEVAFAVNPNPSLDSLRAARRTMDEALRKAGLLPAADAADAPNASDSDSNTATG